MNDFRDRAACKRHELDLFFPIGNGRAAAQQAEKAKRVCRGCPVRSECLQWAFDVRDDVAVLGGTTGEERRAIRRHSSAPAA